MRNETGTLVRLDWIEWYSLRLFLTDEIEQLEQCGQPIDEALNIDKDDMLYTHTFGIFRGYDMLGFVQVRSSGLEGKRHLERIYIRPECREEGVGRTVINFLGIESLHHRREDLEAHKFFKSLGFKVAPYNPQMLLIRMVR